MRTMLAASTGGHLEQLIRLRPRLGPLAGDVLWVTFDTPQSRSRLAGENVVFVRPVPPRHYFALARSLPEARRLLRENDITAVVSTGAGIALSVMPLARARSIPCHYVESAARGHGPSLTGRLLQRVPGVRLYTQYPNWAVPPWHYAGSVFDGLAPLKPSNSAVIRRVVVSLGTIGYGFLRLVSRLHEILPADAEVMWQTGATDVTDLGIEAHASVPAHELDQAMREADLVISHAGVGSALGALEAGRCPILVPRRPTFGEHVDDHQREIAGELAARGLALTREAEELAVEDLYKAAGMRAHAVANPAPLSLCL